MKSLLRELTAIFVPLALSGCSGMAPLQPVDHVELDRFMGDWYVIASIPTALERGAHNAVESYRLNADGTVATTFTFRDGDFEGPRKTYHPRGFVRDESNALWGMQFVWPVKADYRIVYLDESYSTTVIGRNRRDYVWVMAREPAIPEAEFQDIVRFIETSGYDISKLEEVPQRW
jgi:apolipoprotein D and lipocalin family protein